MCGSVDLTTRRVIIGVLGMLFILPFFEIDAGIYGENSGLSTSGLEMIHEMALAGGVDSLALLSSLEVLPDASQQLQNIQMLLVYAQLHYPDNIK